MDNNSMIKFTPVFKLQKQKKCVVFNDKDFCDIIESKKVNDKDAMYYDRFKETVSEEKLEKIFSFIEAYYNEFYRHTSTEKNAGKIMIIIYPGGNLCSNACGPEIRIYLAHEFKKKESRSYDKYYYEIPGYYEAVLVRVMAHEMHHVYFREELRSKYNKNRFPELSDNENCEYECMRACDESLADYFSFCCTMNYFESASKDLEVFQKGYEKFINEEYKDTIKDPIFVNYEYAFGNGLKKYLNIYKGEDEIIENDEKWKKRKKNQTYQYYLYTGAQILYRMFIEEKPDKPGRGWLFFDKFYNLVLQKNGIKAINLLWYKCYVDKAFVMFLKTKTDDYTRYDLGVISSAIYNVNHEFSQKNNGASVFERPDLYESYSEMVQDSLRKMNKPINFVKEVEKRMKEFFEISQVQ